MKQRPSHPLLMWIIAGAFLTIGRWWFFTNNFVSEPGKLDAFATCLSEKNITMYGAAWCKHCQNEKKAFGSSFKYVPYVECPTSPKLCLEKRVNGYPTWIFSDEKKLEGEQGISKLSKESGCPLPEDY